MNIRRKELEILVSFLIVNFWISGVMLLASDAEVHTYRRSISEYPFPGLKEKISLDLMGMDIVDVFKFLAHKGNLNIVADKSISGPVNLLISDVTIGEVLEILLSMNNLAFEVKGDIIKIIPAEKYEALYGIDFYDQRQTTIYQLKYASPKKVATMLGNVKSAIGKIIYDDTTGTLVIIDTPLKIKEMEEIIEKQELPTVTRVFPTETKVFELRYAKVGDIEDEVKNALTPDVGEIHTDEASNTIVVKDLPYRLKEIEKIINAFDRKRREVFIEAKIIQVTLRDEFNSGIDWVRAFTTFYNTYVGRQLAAGGRWKLVESVPGTASVQGKFPQTLPSAFTFTLGDPEVDSFSAVLRFLETYGEVKVLSNPRIAVLENQEAEIMVGTKEAYTTSSITQSQSTTTTAQEVTFVDVGVILKVTPMINKEGFITMEIEPEISDVERYLTTSQGDRIPIIQTANAKTTVMVKDGTTILIGGLIKDIKQKLRVGVPILSRIPLVGILFRSTQDRWRKSELVVLLTPYVITGEEALPGVKPVVKPIPRKPIKGLKE